MKKYELKNAVNSINLKEESKNRILMRALNSREKENNRMSIKKTAILAVAATLVLGVVAFAATTFIVEWSSSSSAIPEFESLPTQEELKEEISFAPTLPEKFENGYVFKNASVVNDEMVDNNGNVFGGKSICARYEKDDGKIDLFAEAVTPFTENYGEVIANVNGTGLYYFQYTNKLVPGDYEMTEADKRAEEAGEIVFSYGSDEVRVCVVKTLGWQKDGVRYELMQFDGELTKGDLAEMAKEML